METITESGACESCGARFTSTRNHLSLRYEQVPAKRFCSERCRKRAENFRRLQREKIGGE